MPASGVLHILGMYSSDLLQKVELELYYDLPANGRGRGLISEMTSHKTAPEQFDGKLTNIIQLRYLLLVVASKLSYASEAWPILIFGALKESDIWNNFVNTVSNNNEHTHVAPFASRCARGSVQRVTVMTTVCFCFRLVTK